MFVCFAASVAITAVRNLACLGGEEILALYLKQAKNKRSMVQFRPGIGGKSSQIYWKIMRGRYVCGLEEEGEGNLTHLGDSGLLIGRDTALSHSSWATQALR